MKKLLIITTLLVTLNSCGEYEPILDSHEYTITDTTYVNENVSGQVLSYDVILGYNWEWFIETISNKPELIYNDGLENSPSEAYEAAITYTLEKLL
jgi:hypothetical protein